MPLCRNCVGRPHRWRPGSLQNSSIGGTITARTGRRGLHPGTTEREPTHGPGRGLRLFHESVRQCVDIDFRGGRDPEALHCRDRAADQLREPVKSADVRSREDDPIETRFRLEEARLDERVMQAQSHVDFRAAAVEGREEAFDGVRVQGPMRPREWGQCDALEESDHTARSHHRREATQYRGGIGLVHQHQATDDGIEPLRAQIGERDLGDIGLDEARPGEPTGRGSAPGGERTAPAKSTPTTAPCDPTISAARQLTSPTPQPTSSTRIPRVQSCVAKQTLGDGLQHQTLLGKTPLFLRRVPQQVLVISRPMEIPCVQLHLLLLALSGVLCMGQVQGMERENPDYRRNADSGFVFLLRMCRLGTYSERDGILPDEPVLRGVPHEIGVRGGLHLLQHPRAVGADGLGTETQLFGDFLHRATRPQETENFVLTM